MVGATRERVNQVMMSLRRLGYIAMDSDQRIVIKDTDRLADICR
jgi:hypothetical protein